MTDTDHDSTPADATDEVGRRWAELEAALARHLVVMTHPDDHLRIEVPDSAPLLPQCPPYAQFAGGEQSFRAEICGNEHLVDGFVLDDAGCRLLTERGWAGNVVGGDVDEQDWWIERPRDRAAEVAADVVTVLRDYFGVVHPDLLVYESWGIAADDGSALGLCAVFDVPVEDEAAAGAVEPVGGDDGIDVEIDGLVVVPGCASTLADAVAATLREKFGSEVERDDDGDFVLHHLDQVVWVRVRADQPAVELMARVVHGVRSLRGAAVETGLLNRDSVWVRWVVRERDVWQMLAIPGMPFAPDHLHAMLDVYFTAMGESRGDLALRTGGRVG